jgi:hypothetical protein
VDNHGFAAAARQLGIPKSTISKRVAELEKSLGALDTALFPNFYCDRDGAGFYRHATAVLIEAASAWPIACHESDG